MTHPSAARARLVTGLVQWHERQSQGLVVEDPLLSTGDLAVLFRVSEVTVRRWANSGKVAYIRTYGGHRRFSAATIWPALQSRLSASELAEASARPHPIAL